MQQNILTITLLISALVVFLGAYNAQAENNTEIIQGSYYSLNFDSFLGYHKKSIILELNQVSRIACSLKCDEVEGCKHIAFSEDNRHCRLLWDVIKANDIDDLVEDFVTGGKVFSVEDFSGKLYLTSYHLNLTRLYPDCTFRWIHFLTLVWMHRFLCEFSRHK